MDSLEGMFGVFRQAMASAQYRKSLERAKASQAALQTQAREIARLQNANAQLRATLKATQLKLRQANDSMDKAMSGRRAAEARGRSEWAKYRDYMRDADSRLKAIKVELCLHRARNIALSRVVQLFRERFKEDSLFERTGRPRPNGFQELRIHELYDRVFAEALTKWDPPDVSEQARATVSTLRVEI